MNYQLPVPTQKAVYEWNYKVNADPNKVGAEIEEIAEGNDGQVMPADLVERARSENSSMHSLFEWDDSAAASKYRTAQGAYILRNLFVRVVGNGSTSNDPKEYVLRSFVNVRVADERFYSPLSVVLVNDEQREYALRDLRNSLMAWRRKSAVYTEFSAIHAAIDRMLTDTVAMPEVFDAVEA